MNTALRDLLTGRYLDHQPSCRCAACESVRAKILIEDIERTYGSCTTIEEVVAVHDYYTDEQLSLAWCPEPPDINEQRARWYRARFRFRQQQQQQLVQL